jgi:hypothetical protein
MKHLKKIARVCGLIILMILAIAGVGIIGIAPTLNKDNKLFADEGSKIEMFEENISEVTREEKLKA